MPYTLRRRKRCFQVYNKKTRQLHSKCTTKRKAQAQIRLLRAIDYNPQFKLRNNSTTTRRRKRGGGNENKPSDEEIEAIRNILKDSKTIDEIKANAIRKSSNPKYVQSTLGYLITDNVKKMI